ncbi:MAG: hypothetical protein WBY94_23280, partial [Polyangiaceae bacterium]
MKRLVFLPAVFALGMAARSAPAQSITRIKDEPTQGAGQGEKDPLRGSTLTFDQSVTTQTVGLGETPQSYVPVYQWWLSL